MEKVFNSSGVRFAFVRVKTSGFLYLRLFLTRMREEDNTNFCRHENEKEMLEPIRPQFWTANFEN